MKKIFFVLIIFVFSFSLVDASTSNWETYLYHKVEAGDTVSGIAERYGLKREDLSKFNKDINNIGDISVGDKIAIPKKGQSKLPEVEKLISRKEKLVRLEDLLLNIITIKQKENEISVVNNLNQLMKQIRDMREKTEENIKQTKAKKIKGLIKAAENWKEISNYFLEEPTLNNFKILCEKSKNIQGPKTKVEEVLDEDRESIKTVEENISLYKSLPICNVLFSDRSNNRFSADYIFVESSEDHMIKLLESDTDGERKEKIKYNEEVKKIIKNYNLYAFPAGNRTERNPATHFKECLNSRQDERYNNPSLSICGEIYTDILIPKIHILRFVNQFSE